MKFMKALMFASVAVASISASASTGSNCANADKNKATTMKKESSIRTVDLVMNDHGPKQTKQLSNSAADAVN